MADSIVTPSPEAFAEELASLTGELVGAAETHSRVEVATRIGKIIKEMAKCPPEGRAPKLEDAGAWCHDGLRIDTEAPVVVFNPSATAADLVSYAYGQVDSARDMLMVLERVRDSDQADAAYAVRGLLDPVLRALELAADKLKAAN